MPEEVQEEGMDTFADLDSRRNDSGNAGNTDDTPRSSASLTVAPPTSTRQTLDPHNASAPASSPLALANRNTAGPSRPRTGAAARERVPGSAYDKALAQEEGEDEQDDQDRSKVAKSKKGKGKAKDEVTQSLSEGFRALQEMAQARAARMEERAAQRQRQEQERLRLENQRPSWFSSTFSACLDPELAGDLCFREAWPDVRTTMLQLVERREAAGTAARQRSIDVASDILGEHSARRRAAQTTAQAAQGSAPSAPVVAGSSTGLTIPGYRVGLSRTHPQAGPSRPLPQAEAGPPGSILGTGASNGEDVNAGFEDLTDDAEGEDEL